MTSPLANDAARALVARPALAIATIAGITFALHLIGIVAVLRQLAGDTATSMPRLAIALLVFVSGALAMAIAWRGARSLARLDSRTAGSRAALLLCVPFWCPLAPIGILVAAWTWHTLGHDAVARGFAQRTPSTTPL